MANLRGRMGGQGAAAIIMKDNRRQREVRRASASVIEALEDRTLFSGLFGAPIPVTLGPGLDPVSMVAGDLNGDGSPDIVVGDSAVAGATNQDQVLLNNGSGVLTPQANAIFNADFHNGTAVALGDVNGDGHLDILQSGSDQGQTRGAVAVGLGTGTGTFTAASQYQTLASGLVLGLQSADLNGDGFSDILTTNAADPTSGLGSVSYRPSKGDGTFSNFADSTETNASPVDILTDIDKDGQLDIVTSYGVMLGRGGGTFTTPRPFPTGNGLALAAVGDFNGDGKPDIALAPGAGQTGQAAAIDIELNSGSSNVFNAGPTVSIGSGLTDVAGLAVGDINGDGKLDLVATLGPSAGAHANSIAVMLGNGDGTFGAADFYGADAGTGPVLVGNFAGHGKADVAVLNTTANTVQIFPNLQSVTPTVTVTSSATTAVAGDLVQFTVKVAGPGAAVPTGAVTLRDGATSLGSAQLQSNGTATFSLKNLAAGTHTITASYAGDSAFTAATSAPLTETIQTPSQHNAADLSAEIAQLKLPSLIVPGDKGTISLVLANHGSKTAAGHIAINLYATTTGTADATSLAIPVSGFKSKAINLKPGRSLRANARFTVPLAIQPGTYKILVQLAPVSGITASDIFSGSTLSSSVQVVDEFGTVGSRKNVTLTQSNSDGSTTTYMLHGPGTGTVSGSGNQVTLDKTTAASQVKLQKKGGNKVVSLGAMTVNGSLGNFDASKANFLAGLSVSGNVNRLNLGNLTSITVRVGSAAKITTGTLIGTSISATHTIGSITVKAWTNGGVLAANTIGTLVSQGEFDPTVNIHGTGLSLRSAHIVGAISGGSWAVHGSIDSLNIGGAVSNTGILAGADFGADNRRSTSDDNYGVGSISSLVVGGAVTSSLFAAGLNPVDNVILNGNDTLFPGGSISVITFKSTLDTQSHVLAASLPQQAVINNFLVSITKDSRFKITR